MTVDEVSAEANEIIDAVEPIVKGRPNVAVAAALAVMAAHHVLHDDQGEEVFLQACGKAWAKAKELHAKNCQH